MKQKINYTEKIRELKDYVKRYYPNFPYHNYNHCLDVLGAITKYSNLTNLTDKDKFLLGTAALFHDIVYIQKRKDNEEKSADYAVNYLSNNGYESGDLVIVSGLILATKWPQKPKNFLEQLICDADLDSLGREDFFEKSENLRIEWGVYDKERWYYQQLELLENHNYFTEVARKLRDPMKKMNIQKLKELIGEKKKC